MRTTLTIDDDIAKLLRDEVRRSGDTFKGTVNRMLRDGLTAGNKPRANERFSITPFNLNLGELGLGTRYEKAQYLLDALDGPLHR